MDCPFYLFFIINVVLLFIFTFQFRSGKDRINIYIFLKIFMLFEIRFHAMLIRSPPMPNPLFSHYR